MFSATRRWFQRNRTPIAVGAGVIGAGYLATQYVLAKINDARERMSSDRIAKENLRRRFEQNQEDCTFTVLALLPTATASIIEAMNTEKITLEIQQMKGVKSARSVDSSATPPSIADTTLTEEEGKSTASLQSDSGVHASQIALPSPSAVGDGAQDGGQATASAQKPKRTKRQLWDDLTISSITRAFTLIYTLALLTMLTRVQLNLLGRRSYLSSVISLATGTGQSTISLENNDDDNSEQSYGNDFDTNRKYLTFSWWLLNRGWDDLMKRVEEAVRDVFGHLSPRDLLSFDTFSQLALEVRKKIEGPTEGPKWLSLLLPPQDQEAFVLKESGVLGDSATAETGIDTSTSPSPISSSLRRMLDETSDLVESPAFSHVLTLLLDSGFSLLLNGKLLQGTFETQPTSGSIPELEEEQISKVVLLPKILSVLTRQAHVIGNGMPNEYLQEMEGVKDLEAFAAVVYSSNWENEIQPDDGFINVAKPEPTSQSQGVKPSQVSESVVIVDRDQPTQTSFESAWEKATEQS
ncbi:peroxin 3 [Seiridium cupressi]|uniref:Peroxisomal biogenesis factor 3 n=1 Tax=Seiridium unicorne TaxID=138068 RepID=A0ABR2VFZ5_9PEZI